MQIVLTSIEDINEDGRDQVCTMEVGNVETAEDLMYAFSQFATVAGFRFISQVGCVTNSGKEFWSQ